VRPAAAAAQQQQQQRPPRPPRCCWLIMRLFSSREDDLGSIFDFLVLYIISTVVRIKLPRRTVDRATSAGRARVEKRRAHSAAEARCRA
jgi:hypothetical protein